MSVLENLEFEPWPYVLLFLSGCLILVLVFFMNHQNGEFKSKVSSLQAELRTVKAACNPLTLEELEAQKKLDEERMERVTEAMKKWHAEHPNWADELRRQQ